MVFGEFGERIAAYNGVRITGSGGGRLAVTEKIGIGASSSWLSGLNGLFVALIGQKI